jgi:hypothetical protein
MFCFFRSHKKVRIEIMNLTIFVCERCRYYFGFEWLSEPVNIQASSKICKSPIEIIKEKDK